MVTSLLPPNCQTTVRPRTIVKVDEASTGSARSIGGGNARVR
jgi:hypothetical protein